MQDDEAPQAPRREIVYALLALASILIGLSRLADAAAPPLWLQATDVAIGLAFLADWIRRIREASRPGRYALRNGYEILTFVPFTLLPALGGGDLVRSVRLVRLVRFARYGRFAKVGLALARFPTRMRYLRRLARNAQLVTILVVGILVVAAGAVVLLVAERDAIASGGYGGALWWSLNLFTTVSYAVPPPRTPIGYAASGALMVAGVGYIGVLTASLASAILRTEAEDLRPSSERPQAASATNDPTESPPSK